MGLDDLQLALCAVGVAALIAGLMGITWWLCGPIIVLVVAGVPTWFTGRPLVRWVPMLGTFVLRGAIGQRRFRVRPTQPRPVGTLGLPGTAARLRLMVEPGTGAGLVHDPSKKTMTAVLRVHPQESFLLAEGSKQDTMADGWASILGAFCADASGGITRVSVLMRAVSDGGQEIAAWFEEHGSSPLSEEAHEAYREYLHFSRTEAMRHEAYVAISLDMTKRGVAQMIRSAGGGVHGGIAVLRSRMDYLTSQLSDAALTSLGWLNAGEVARLARYAYDPASQSELEESPGVGTSAAAAGPMAVDEYFSYFQTEGGFHRVLMIAEWPRKKTTAGFLQRLVTARVKHTFSMVFEPIETSKAIRQAQGKASEAETAKMLQARTGGVDTPERRRERESLAREEEDLESGQGALNFAGLVTVSADSLDELRIATDQVRTAARRSGCELRMLGGQQCSAFEAAAMPLGRGL